MKRTVFIFVTFAFLLTACNNTVSTPIITPTNTPLSTPTINSTPTPTLAPTLTVPVRDLSTPLSRLVGHWRRDTPTGSGEFIEYYYSPIDPTTGIGRETEYNTLTGSVYIMTYKVFSETPNGEDLTIIRISPDGTVNTLKPYYEIPKDGLTAQMMKFTITYIDDKTEFDPADRDPTDVYQAVIDTGLYKTKESETAYYTIQVGELLIPANGASTALCEPSNREGVNAHMCYMQSLSSGETGWVFRPYIAKVN